MANNVRDEYNTLNNITSIDNNLDIQIYYGIEHNYKDITYVAMNKCVKNNILIIPAGDSNRSEIFGDPIFGTLKHIMIKNSNSNDKSKIFNHDQIISYNLNKTDIDSYKNYIKKNILNLSDVEKLNFIHNNLNINFGSFKEEYPEQLMAIKFIKGNEKILELGANIGRNSLIILICLFHF